MGKLISSLIALPIIGGVLNFIISIILAGLLTLTYSSLTKEVPIASLVFSNESNNTKVYEAHLYDAKHLKIGDYTIYGDQWRLDAGFIKMKYWANIIGMDSKYVLNRLEGRYKNIHEENNNIHHAYQIEEHALIDDMGFFFDTSYGSSVYKKIKLNTKYIVLKSQTGLMVREEPFHLVKKKSFIEKTKAMFGF